MPGKKRARGSAGKPTVEVVVFSDTSTHSQQRRSRGSSGSKRPERIVSSSAKQARDGKGIGGGNQEGLDFDAAFLEVHSLGQ
jgi:hypothetical protein